MEEIEKHVARITSTHLGYEDHGILTIILGLDYGGSGQSAGVKALGGDILEQEIRGILAVAGVESWEQVKGKTIHAYASYSRVHGIEQLPIDGNKRYAFNPEFDGWTNG